MLHVSVSAYKQAGAEWRSDPICRKVGGGGICKRPGRGVTMVQYTITTRVDGDVLKVFWSYCSEVGFIKVPRNNKRCIWVRFMLLPHRSKIIMPFISQLFTFTDITHCFCNSCVFNVNLCVNENLV